MAFALSTRAAALPVLVLGPGACSDVAASGRPRDHVDIDAAFAARLPGRPRWMLAACQPPCCLADDVKCEGVPVDCAMEVVLEPVFRADPKPASAT